MDTDYTMLMRSFTLLIACLGGILSIFLGWRLYCKGVESAVQSDLSTEKKFRLQITAVGPGVFFALFGMLIIYKVVNMQAEVSEEVPIEATQSSLLVPDLQLIPHAMAAERPRYCLIVKRVRRQYDGSEVGVAAVNDALDASIRAVRESAPQSENQAELVNNLQTLLEMRASTGEWRMR